jgi:putative FmdB family regulatory protein
MPLYDYVCAACGHKFTWLVAMVAGSSSPVCDRCKSASVSRLPVTRVAVVRTDEQALDALAEENESGELDDPAAMRRWSREMGSELGEDLGDEFDEFV